MSVRIYSLAKELNLENKVVVEACTQAGISGKGSALASLTDEEAGKVREVLKGGASASKAEVATKAENATKAASATHAEDESSAGAPSAAKALGMLRGHRTARPSARPITRPQKQKSAPEPVDPNAPMRREDYVAPAGGSGKVRTLGDKPSTEKKNGDAVKSAPRTGPSIKLAPLPNAEQPTESKPAANEPAPQKPDIRLPADAIRAGRMGSKPLAADELKKHEPKKPAKKSAASRGPGLPPIPPAEPGSGKPLQRDWRGKSAADNETDRKKTSVLGGREQRQLGRKRRPSGGDDDQVRRRGRRRIKRTGANTAAPRKSNVTIELPCTVRSFSEALGIPSMAVLRELIALGVMSNINAKLDDEMAELLAEQLGAEAKFRHAVDIEDDLLAAIRDLVDPEDTLATRPPVITFLGHVDHGKTSLLDKIIGIDVVSGESGGITQHIRAYQIEKNGQFISFVDTPGHEAFTEMRARGANVTDIAVLVIAADDGIMPQTEEAISHARAAGVPIVVALNKIDLPGVTAQRTLEQLAANELLPAEWGGETEVVKTSAMSGEGLDELLDTVLTVAELHDYKANANRPAMGTCLESSMHDERGVIAKMIVQNGTMRVGDVIVCGNAYGRVRAIENTLTPGLAFDEAGPSVPVNITGLDEAPGAGEHFYVLEDIGQARQIAEKRRHRSRESIVGGDAPVRTTLENLFETLGAKEVPTVNLILRADTKGSIDAIRKELTKLEHDEVKIKILQATVGGVSEADVHLADASDAIIIAFNVVPDEGARGLSDRRGIQVNRYEVIYKITDDLKAALEGKLEPEKREADLGRALVKQAYKISRIGTIAGCQVIQGVIQRGAKVRVIRENRIIGDYPIDTLRRVKDDAKEVRQGYECGIKLAGFNDIKEGDILEAYKVEEIARTLD